MIAAHSARPPAPSQPDINTRLTAFELTRDAIRRALAGGTSVPPAETSATLDALVAQAEAQQRELEGLHADLAEANAEAAITNALTLLDGLHELVMVFAGTQLAPVAAVLPRALQDAATALEQSELARETAARAPSKALLALSDALDSHGATIRLLTHMGEYIADAQSPSGASHGK